MATNIDGFLGEDGTTARPGETQSSIDSFLPAKKPSALRSAADSAIALGTGLAQGVQMLTNVAGADNAVSQGIGDAIGTMRGWESPERQAERAARAEKIKQAEESGSTWEEVKAYAGSFAEAPLDTTLEALGTAAPTIAGAALTGGGSTAAQLAARAAPMALGAAQGVGAVKGEIHESVENRWKEAGASDEEAAARAAEAQSYAGENAGNIALGGALGVLAGSTGVESAVRRMAGSSLAREAAERAAPGVVRGALTGALYEAPMEALQGGQERYAANVAGQREGFDVPTWQGVAGQATLEGMASAPLGGGFGAANAYAAGRQRPTDGAPPQDGGAATDNPGSTGPTPPEAGLFDQAAPPPVLDADALERAGISQTPGAILDEQQLQRWGVDSLPPAAAPQVKPSEQMGLDPAAGPMSAAAAMAVDSGASAQAPQAAQAVDPETGEVLQQQDAPGSEPATGIVGQLEAAQGPEQVRDILRIAEVDDVVRALADRPDLDQVAQSGLSEGAWNLLRDELSTARDLRARDRLAFVEQQARVNGGWDSLLVNERNRLLNELGERRAASAGDASGAGQAAQAVDTAGSPAGEQRGGPGVAQSQATREAVDAVKQQTAEAIGQRLQGMKAGEVNTFAARILPAMGLKPTASKARNIALLTDGARVNLYGVAGELGVELSEASRSALESDMAGTVAEPKVEGGQQATNADTQAQANAVAGSAAAEPAGGQGGGRAAVVAPEDASATQSESAGIEAARRAAASLALDDFAAESARREREWIARERVRMQDIAAGDQTAQAALPERQRMAPAEAQARLQELDAAEASVDERFSPDALRQTYELLRGDQMPVKNESRANADDSTAVGGADQETAAQPAADERIAAPDGSIDFGEITPEMAQASPQGGTRLDRAMSILLDRTDNNGSPDGLGGPKNADARTAIVSALTGQSVADIEAAPNYKFVTSVPQVERLLYDAAGIPAGNLAARRAPFLDWVDARGEGQPSKGRQLGHGDGQKDPGTLPDNAVVTDADGNRYWVRSARHFTVRATPLQGDARPDPSMDAATTFNLREGDTLDPGERRGPLFFDGELLDAGGAQRQAQPAAQPEQQPNTPADRWQAMTPEQRQDALVQAGYVTSSGKPNIVASANKGKAWGDLAEKVRDRLAESMGQQEPQAAATEAEPAGATPEAGEPAAQQPGESTGREDRQATTAQEPVAAPGANADTSPDAAAESADATERGSQESEVGTQADATPDESPAYRLTFDQWLEQKWAAQAEYHASYLEGADGDLQKAKHAAASSGGESEASARVAYWSELMNAPRDADVSLEMYDGLTDGQKADASKHFFKLDDLVRDRYQRDAMAKKAESDSMEREVIAPMQAEVDRLRSMNERTKSGTDAWNKRAIDAAKVEGLISDLRAGRITKDELPAKWRPAESEAQADQASKGDGFKFVREVIADAYGQASGYSLRGKQYTPMQALQHQGRIETKLVSAGLKKRDAKEVVERALTIKAQESRGGSAMTFLEAKYVLRAAADLGIIAPVDIEGRTIAAPDAASPAPAQEGKASGQESEKAKWIKATVDKSRLNGSGGVQLAVAPNGGVTFMGDPNTSKDGRALLANYEKALASGATQQEIAAALQAQQAKAPAAAPEAEAGRSAAARQFRETEAAYGGREAFERAKAAGKTKLNYRQWVQVRTPNFKRWFGDWENDPASASKVTDPKTGEPMVVYHGTLVDFNAFDRGAESNFRYGEAENSGGIFFGTSPESVEYYLEGRRGFERGANILPAFVSIRNPASIDDAPRSLAEQARLLHDAEAAGHDGALIGDQVIAFAPGQAKSATGNQGTFDGSNPDIRFSFAGRTAQTADQYALAAAQRRIAMGENAESVRQDTGWHRGDDGKWRFEISDDQARVAVGGANAAEIYDAALLDGEVVRVADVLDHPQLFAAYPHLADVRVELLPAVVRAQARYQHSAHTGAGLLQINPRVKREAMVKTLLHELQHGIQFREGFAQGGSPEAFASDSQEQGADTYRRLAGEVESRNVEARRQMTPEQRRAIAPGYTSDTMPGDVLVTFNGKRIVTPPHNATSRMPMTESGLLRAVRRQFPGLAGDVEKMLGRGLQGKKGGLVMIDSADPLQIARVFAEKTGRTLDEAVEMFSKEDGSINGFYDPKSGLTFMVGPNLDPVTALAVLLHESVHGQQRENIDAQAMDMLTNRMEEKDESTREFLDRAAQRMIEAGVATDSKEAAPYIVEQAVIEGRSAGYKMADSKFFAWADRTFGKKIGDFLRSVAAMVRTWMIRNGLVRKLTVDDLVGYAMAGVGRAAEGNVRASSDAGRMSSVSERGRAASEQGAADSGADGIQFSRSGRSAAELARSIGDGLKSMTVQNVKKAGRHKLTDWLKLGLQFMGRRQLVDVYGDVLPMADYDRLAAQMEADKNDVGAAADDLARRWGKLPDEGKLADLMHDATLAGIDADSEVAYVPGDDRAKSSMLKAQFKALTPEAQKVYREARDHYKRHHSEVRQALADRIMRSELSSERRAELLKRMDDDFFKSVKGVYFPLARFGQYVVVTRDAAGQVVSVSRAETMSEAEAMRQEMVKGFPASDGYRVGRVTLSKEFVAGRDMVGRGFMSELFKALDEQHLAPGVMAELEDTLGQLYLSSLPDLSWAKHGIHRKGTPGFSQDARRAFAQNTFHGARYLAKLRYGDQMQAELDRMQKHADEMSPVEGFDQPAAQRVVDEMNKRHEAMMNPKSNPLSTALTSFGFLYYLGISPAAAIVNLSQTPLVAYPVMGAKWGFRKAGAALMRASAETMEGKNDLRSRLKNPDEIRAYDEAVRTGVIDVTMAHDLSGIAQGEDAKVMWKMRPVMRAASFLFHHAERFNRQATFLAAYRLARDAGAKHDTAYSQAVKATYDGHFDYSSGNRPRVMQGNVARVVLLFKQYAQNMIFTLSRNAYQSVKGASPEVRREARRMFGALLTLHAAAAGVLGLPLVGTLLTVASALGGDDDEPWDAEVALRNLLADAFGPKASEVVARGFSRLTPWDISGRVGLDKLLLPDVQEGLEGQRWAEAFSTAMLGPVIGMGVNAAKAAQKMADGDYGRGLEDLLPIFARNPIKAYRYWDEGAQDRTGIEIKGDVGMAGVIGQAAGFSPSEVRLAFEGRSAVMDADRRLSERRSELMSQFARAAMDQDIDAMNAAREAIRGFNEKNPGRRITAPQMWQSVRNRQKRIRESEDGVYLPRTRRDLMDAGRFAGA